MVPTPRLMSRNCGKLVPTNVTGTGQPSTVSATERSICSAYASPSAPEISPSRFVSIQSNTLEARAAPAVRSISRSTCSMSIDRRVAWRYSSNRCALAGDIHPIGARWLEGRLPARRTGRRAAGKVFAGSWSDKFRAVIVGWVAVDGVDVIEVALLRCILNDYRRPLDAVIRQASVLRGSAPGEIRFRQVGLDFRHLCRCRLVVEDADPLMHHVEQQSLLTRVQFRGGDALRLDHFSVGSGTQHQIGHLIVEDRALLLPRIERTDERKTLVVFTAKRPNGLAVQGVLRRLSRRQAGGHHAVGADNRDVDGKMMPAKLNHPRLGRRRGSEERHIVLIESEPNASANPAGTPASLSATGPSAAGILQHLVTVHDVGDLLVALTAQGRGDQRKGRLALPRRHVAEAQAISLKDSGGKVGPASPLGAVEAERASGPLRRAEGRKERVSRLDHLPCYGSVRRGRGRRR